MVDYVDGAYSQPRNFQAVVVLLNKKSTKMTEKLRRYHTVPNIVFVGDTFIPNDFSGKVAFPEFSLKVVT